MAGAALVFVSINPAPKSSVRPPEAEKRVVCKGHAGFWCEFALTRLRSRRAAAPLCPLRNGAGELRRGPGTAATHQAVPLPPRGPPVLPKSPCPPRSRCSRCAPPGPAGAWPHVLALLPLSPRPAEFNKATSAGCLPRAFKLETRLGPADCALGEVSRGEPGGGGASSPRSRPVSALQPPVPGVPGRRGSSPRGRPGALLLSLSPDAELGPAVPRSHGSPGAGGGSWERGSAVPFQGPLLGSPFGAEQKERGPLPPPVK